MAKKEEQLEKLTEVFDNIRPEYVQAAANPQPAEAPVRHRPGKVVLRWVLIAAAAVALVGVLFAGFIFNGYLKEKYGRPGSSGTAAKTDNPPVTETPPITEGPEGTGTLPEGTTGAPKVTEALQTTEVPVTTSTAITTETPEKITEALHPEDSTPTDNAGEETSTAAVPGTGTPGTEPPAPPTGDPGFPAVPAPLTDSKGNLCAWTIEYYDRTSYDYSCGKPCEACYKCEVDGRILITDRFTVKEAGHVYNSRTNRCYHCLHLDDAYLEAEGLTYSLNPDGTYAVTGMSSNCPYTTIYIPAEYQGKRVTDIAPAAFAGNTKIQTVWMEGLSYRETSLPASVQALLENRGIRRIGAHAFDGCTSLTKVYLPKTLEEIGDYAFRYTKPGELVILGTIRSIGSYAFYGTKITRFDMENAEIETLPPYVFAESTLPALSCPMTVTSVGAHAFENCSNLSTVANLLVKTSIGEYAFAGCTALNHAQYVDPLHVSVGKDAFKDCPAGVTTMVDPVTGLAYVLDVAMDGSPKVVASIVGRGNWQGTDLIIPATVGGYPVAAVCDAFGYDAALTSVTLESENAIYIGNSFRSCPRLQSVSILSPVDFYWSSFYNCTVLNRVILWDTEAAVNAYQFVNCPGSPTQPDANGLVYRLNPDGQSYSIYLYISQAAQTKDAVLPSTYRGLPVTRISPEAFAKTDLNSVVIPASILEIGNYAFADSYLTSVTLPEGLKSIPDSCFSRAYRLKRITLPESLKTIGKYAFNESGLESIRIPDSVTEVGEGAFWKTSNLKELPLGKGMRHIPSRYWCYQVSRIVIPAHITSVDRCAFSLALREVEYMNPETELTGPVLFASQESGYITWVPGISYEMDEESGVRLYLQDGVYRIAGATPTATAIRFFPTEYRGIPVVAIDDYAFYNLQFASSPLCVIPKTYTDVGMNAFHKSNIRVSY